VLLGIEFPRSVEEYEVLVDVASTLVLVPFCSGSGVVALEALADEFAVPEKGSFKPPSVHMRSL